MYTPVVSGKQLKLFCFITYLCLCFSSPNYSDVVSKNCLWLVSVSQLVFHTPPFNLSHSSTPSPLLPSSSFPPPIQGGRREGGRREGGRREGEERGVVEVVVAYHVYYSHVLSPLFLPPPPPSSPLFPSPSFPATSFPPPPSLPVSRSPSLKRHSTCTSNALMPVCRDSTQNWRPASMRYRAWCSQREERW